jgi:hypothetical protein
VHLTVAVYGFSSGRGVGGGRDEVREGFLPVLAWTFSVPLHELRDWVLDCEGMRLSGHSPEKVAGFVAAVEVRVIERKSIEYPFRLGIRAVCSSPKGEEGGSDGLHDRLEIRCSGGIVEVSESGMLFD